MLEGHGEQKRGSRAGGHREEGALQRPNPNHPPAAPPAGGLSARRRGPASHAGQKPGVKCPGGTKGQEQSQTPGPPGSSLDPLPLSLPPHRVDGGDVRQPRKKPSTVQVPSATFTVQLGKK